MGNPITTTSVPTSHFGGLRLPSGKLIKDYPDHELRTELHRLGIVGAHSDALNVICQRFHDRCQRIWDEAGRKALDTWLEQSRE